MQSYSRRGMLGPMAKKLFILEPPTYEPQGLDKFTQRLVDAQAKYVDSLPPLGEQNRGYRIDMHQQMDRDGNMVVWFTHSIVPVLDGVVQVLVNDHNASMATYVHK
jgi:hypothetical protein